MKQLHVCQVSYHLDATPHFETRYSALHQPRSNGLSQSTRTVLSSSTHNVDCSCCIKTTKPQKVFKPNAESLSVLIRKVGYFSLKVGKRYLCTESEIWLNYKIDFHSFMFLAKSLTSLQVQI